MKFSRSKIMIVLEKIYFLMLINTMILIGSMFFVTFLNSISAGIYSLKDYLESDNEEVIKSYWKKFKEISYKGIYTNTIVYIWFGMLYVYRPFLTVQQISGLIIFYFLSIELIVFTIGLIKVYSSKRIDSVFQNTKKALLIGHLELPSLFVFFISILSSLLILYKIRFLIPLFIVGPIYLLMLFNNKFSKIRSTK